MPRITARPIEPGADTRPDGSPKRPARIGGRVYMIPVADACRRKRTHPKTGKTYMRRFHGFNTYDAHGWAWVSSAIWERPTADNAEPYFRPSSGRAAWFALRSFANGCRFRNERPTLRYPVKLEIKRGPLLAGRLLKLQAAA